MKRKILFGSILMLSLGSVFGQGEMDAYRLSQNELRGTARSVAMGGAFGALGGDISGISINPAGIGIYTKSEIVTTVNFQNTKTENKFGGGTFEEKKFKANFDNLAFVATFPMMSDVAPLLNFGFSYNRLKNFDRKYTTRGNGVNGSLADYIASRANEAGVKPNDLWIEKGGTYKQFSDYSWLPILGYNSHLITYDKGEYKTASYLQKINPGNYFYAEEKGAIDTYDFNFGTTFSNVVSAGLSVSVTDINYRMYSQYTEDYLDNGRGGFDLFNNLKTEGTGWQISAGLIIKPIDELRIGVSYHSPTWYNMTDYYNAEMQYDMSGFVSTNYPTSSDRDLFSGNYDFNYRLRTPDKWTFSLAGVIGQMAIISADYEYNNYGNSMKLFDEYGGNFRDNPNKYISQDFKGASTLRLGAEVRFTPRFSGRIGYAWIESPMKENITSGEQEVMTVGSDSHYLLTGNKNYFTYGLGYKLSRNFYTDVAFVMMSQKDKLLPFYSPLNTIASEMKTSSFQGLLTLGYKF